MSEYIIHIEDAKTLYKYTDFDFSLDSYLRGKIVRCVDCKHYNSYQDLCERLKPGMVVMGDGFCAWGERIEP